MSTYLWIQVISGVVQLGASIALLVALISQSRANRRASDANERVNRAALEAFGAELLPLRCPRCRQELTEAGAMYVCNNCGWPDGET